MIENLRLDPAGKTINNTTTNNPKSTFLNEIPSTAPSSFQQCQTNSSACVDKYSVGISNITGTNSNATGTGQSYRWAAYGAMYNWCTATTGYGTYSVSSYATSIAGDICPAGWHLPSGRNASGEFGTLDIAIGGTGAATSGNDPTGALVSNYWRSYPINIVYGGSYKNTTTNNRGTGGGYWTSMANNSSTAYVLNVAGSSVSPGTGNREKFVGNAVRCVINP